MEMHFAGEQQQHNNNFYGKLNTFKPLIKSRTCAFRSHRFSRIHWCFCSSITPTNRSCHITLMMVVVRQHNNTHSNSNYYSVSLSFVATSAHSTHSLSHTTIQETSEVNRNWVFTACCGTIRGTAALICISNNNVDKWVCKLAYTLRRHRRRLVNWKAVDCRGTPTRWNNVYCEQNGAHKYIERRLTKLWRGAETSPYPPGWWDFKLCIYNHIKGTNNGALCQSYTRSPTHPNTHASYT